MKKKTLLVIFILILVVIISSGCLDFNNKYDKNVIYEPKPVKISYTISYGYEVTCEGTGSYVISYDCDLPEVLTDKVTNIIGFNNEYEKITLLNNLIKRWNISSTGNNQYRLGITADVEAETFLISDLNGKDALSIQNIKEKHIDIYTQYTKAQYNETKVAFINPDDFYIRAVAENQLSKSNSNNSFIVAKQLLIWLKENTFYKTHDDDTIQTASTTIKKGSGDCDDLSFLYISLCRSIGIPARFIRGFIVNENTAVSHAWVEVFVGGEIGNNGWIPVECAGTSSDMSIQVNQNFAIEHADHLRLFTDQGNNESLIFSFYGIKVKYEKTITDITIKPIIEVSSYSVSLEKKLTVDNNNNRYYK